MAFKFWLEYNGESFKKLNKHLEACGSEGIVFHKENGTWADCWVCFMKLRM
jgi:hypothetical protein